MFSECLLTSVPCKFVVHNSFITVLQNVHASLRLLLLKPLTSKREREFDRLLLESVDEALSSLGEASKEAIYFHLEKSFNIKKCEIPMRIEDFAHAMEKIFGLGASFLEVLIMKRLYNKIGGVFQLEESENFVFTEYVAAVKRSFLKGKREK